MASPDLLDLLVRELDLFPIEEIPDPRFEVLCGKALRAKSITELKIWWSRNKETIRKLPPRQKERISRLKDRLKATLPD